MTDTAQGQILDAFGDLLRDYPDLAEENIITDRSPEEAIADEETPCTVIYCEAWRFDDAPMQGQTRHDMLINFECIETSANVGIISRANQARIAHIVAALHGDPTLGGRLEDCRPIDVAPPMDNGKSIGGASLQVAIRFYTPLGDHFTIVT